MPFVKATLEQPAMTLAADYYTSQSIFERERERIFARHWICVGRTEQIANPGDFFLANVADESLIVTRDRSGEIHALYNVCRHRGTRLCEESAGHFNGSVQCPYHAWTYALDGSLLAARNMDDVPGFDRAQYPLARASCVQFEGFIFVNLARQPVAFAQQFAVLAGRFAQWNIAELRVGKTIRYELACNWKLVFLNYSECYHCPVLHPQLDKLSPSESGRNDLSEGPVLGGYSLLRPEVHALTASGQTNRDPFPTLDDDNKQRIYYYTIFPSLLLSLHPDYIMVHYVRPLSAISTAVECVWLFAPDAIGDPRFDASDAVDFWDLTNRQDWHVNQLTQAGMGSRAYAPGPYAHAEALLAAFDRHYLHVMEGE